MKRAVVAFSLISAGLLFGCGDRPDLAVGDTSQPGAEPIETSQPAPTNPGAPVQAAPLEINTFSLEELIEKGGLGCSVLLKRSVQDDDYVLFDGPELALMKVEGSWIEFFHDEGSAFGDEAIALTSQNGAFALRVDMVRGDRIGNEVSEISEATIELQLEDEPATVISAVGEVGC